MELEIGEFQLTEKTPLEWLKGQWPNWNEWVTDFNDEGVVTINEQDIDSVIFIALLMRYICPLCDEEIADWDKNNVTCNTCGSCQHIDCPKYDISNFNEPMPDKWFCYLCKPKK